MIKTGHQVLESEERNGYRDEGGRLKMPKINSRYIGSNYQSVESQNSMQEIV